MQVNYKKENKIIDLITSTLAGMDVRFDASNGVTGLLISRAKDAKSLQFTEETPLGLDRLCESWPELRTTILQKCDLKGILLMRELSRAWLHFISPGTLLISIKDLCTRLDQYQNLAPEIQNLCKSLTKEYGELIKKQPLANILSSRAAIRFEKSNFKYFNCELGKIDFAKKENIEICTSLSSKDILSDHIVEQIKTLLENRLKLNLKIEQCNEKDSKKIEQIFSNNKNEHWINAINRFKFDVHSNHLIKAIFQKKEWFINLKEAEFASFDNDVQKSLPDLWYKNFEVLKYITVEKETEIKIHNASKLKSCHFYALRRKTTVNLSGALPNLEYIQCLQMERESKCHLVNLSLFNLTTITCEALDRETAINLSGSYLPNLRKLILKMIAMINLSKSTLGLKEFVFNPIHDSTINLRESSLANLEIFRLEKMGEEVTIDLFGCFLPKLKEMNLGYQMMGRKAEINLYNASMDNLEKFFLGDLNKSNFIAPKKLPKLNTFYIENISSEFDLSGCCLPLLKELHFRDIKANVKLPLELPNLEILKLGYIGATIELPKSLPALKELNIREKKAELTEVDGLKTFSIENASENEKDFLQLINEAINYKEI